MFFLMPNQQCHALKDKNAVLLQLRTDHQYTRAGSQQQCLTAASHERTAALTERSYQCEWIPVLKDLLLEADAVQVQTQTLHHTRMLHTTRTPNPVHDT